MTNIDTLLHVLFFTRVYEVYYSLLLGQWIVLQLIVWIEFPEQLCPP